MSTISIKYCDIPTWLKAGGLYRSLSPANVEDIITIPAGCFMETTDCWTDEDANLDKCCQLIRIVVHWMLDEMPVEVLEFCVKHHADMWHDAILKESKVLAPLLEIDSINQVMFRMAMNTGELDLIVLAAGKVQNKMAATAIAAQEGNLSILKLLHEQGFAWDEITCWKASKNDYLDCLQYAHKNGCPWDHQVYIGAACSGHLHIMQYAYQQGLREWHANVCTCAAQEGHLTCLQFAYENGCPWDVQTTQEAAEAGHLLTLRYVMEQGCPYNSNVTVLAVISGSVKCLQYLVEEQAMPMYYVLFETSLLSGNFSCLQYLMDQGCPFLSATYASITLDDEQSNLIFQKNNPEFTQCVRYAVERGWKPNPAFCKYISSRDPECTAYLWSEGLFVDSISIRYRNIPKWLQAGDFYRNLSSEDPEDLICIPTECYTQENEWNDDDKSVYDFIQLIRVAMFWILDEIPFGILEVCARYSAEEWRDVILGVPGAEESGIFTPFLGVYPFELEKSFALIIRTGRFEVIIRAAKLMCNAIQATAIAAQEGNLPVLKLLHEQGFAWDEETCLMASQNGHLDCLQYAHENGCSWDYQVYQSAARYGHLHIMQYAFQQGLEWHKDACKFAAITGQLKCLQFAHENGCPWDDVTVSYASSYGHLSSLQYALAQGCPISDSACAAACQKGQLLCLQLLHEYDAPWDESTCKCAAECSDVSCLQFLHEHGCPWDKSTLHRAVLLDHLTVLRYAMERGCPHDDFLMEYVAQHGSMECIWYFVEVQGLFMSTNVFTYTLLRGELAHVQYLIDQACPFLDTFDHYMTTLEKFTCDDVFIKDNPEFTQCVQYAVERGWAASRSFCEYISSRDAECTAYLRSEGLFLM